MEPTVADLLQQALRHHQLGELPKAEAIYRAVLQREPDNADALHWLGIVAHQSRRPDVALGLIGRAVQLAPNVASYQHNYAEAWMAVGEIDQAIAAYRRAVELDPSPPQSHASLGIALRRRGREADAAIELQDAVRRGEHHPEVVRHLVQALAATARFDDAAAVARDAIGFSPDAGGEAHRALGEMLGLSSRFEEAALAFRRAAELRPNDPRARQGLGVALGRLGKLDDAIASFREAVRLRTDYPDAHRGLAAIFFRTDRLDDAATHYEAALRTRPGDVGVRRELAALRERQGRLEDAAEQFRQIAAARPEASKEVAFHLAAVGAGDAPPVPPPGYVAAYFNDYAETFDRHLVEKLAYRAPQLVHEAVTSTAATAPPAPFDIIDLGCGTGLCAPLLKPLARSIVGVDLSPAMLAKARDRQLYDELIQGDLVEALAARPNQFDLAVAADVLVYFGDLAPVLCAAATALRPGGRFAFTVEADTAAEAPADAPGYRLCPTRRYVHAAAYLHRAAGATGFTVPLLQPAMLRTERNQPVDGYVVLLQKR